MIFVGDDLAEAHHDVCVLDEHGERLAKRRVPEGLGGIGQLHALLAEHASEPSEVVIGIETDRGLWVAALLERELADAFMHQPDAEILRSLPGLGIVLGARVLGEFGDSPNRHKDAKARRCYAGTAQSPAPPAPGRRLLPLGLRSPHRLTRRAIPLRPPTPTRSDPPQGPASARQPARRHPRRLPPPPRHLRRNDRLGAHPRHSHLTVTPVGCLGVVA